jgi:hypothetical protein
MIMRIIIKILLILTLGSILCFGSEITELKKILITKGQKDYFPASATYNKLPDICNKYKCFTIVTVEYVSESLKGMRRLAVFSSQAKYLGCYSGLDDLPVGVEGHKLKFKKSKYGDEVIFKGDNPPKTMWVDGAIYKYEKL